ncbi:hypothetical protein OIU85_008915 [Salix viminalis]|uniref:Uncharacterized protein n=1 Tax=Salix viminalis TaxID=40686 RepID=A0A9Q0SIT1_SALVM|nr:hypothetical protein OIU85_008915 [Salix viminalis]
MKSKSIFSPQNPCLKSFFSAPLESLMATSLELNDDSVCSNPQQTETIENPSETALLGEPRGYLSGEAHVERAWGHWSKLGRPKLIVAPYGG